MVHPKSVRGVPRTNKQVMKIWFFSRCSETLADVNVHAQRPPGGWSCAAQAPSPVSGFSLFQGDPEIGLGVLSSTASALRTRNEDTLETLSDQV